MLLTLTLRVTAPASVIDQDAAHHLGGDGEEVRPVLPIYVPLLEESQVKDLDR